MTWWDTANDPSRSTRDRVAAGVGCGLLPWLCLAQEGEQAAAEATARASQQAGDFVRGVGSSVEMLTPGGDYDVMGAIGTVVDSASEPLDRMESIIKWTAIGLGAVVLLVLLGLLTWFVALPLMGLGGPRGVIRG